MRPRRRARRVAVVGLALLGAALGAPAWAADRDGSEDAESQRAEQTFREAVSAFASGRYHTAIDLFAAADRIRPRPELSFDIARSYDKLGDDSSALGFYREYLRRAGHPSDEAEVEHRVQVLESRLADHGVQASPLLAAPAATIAPPPPPRVAEPARPDRADRPGETHDSATLRTLGWVSLGVAAAAFGGAVVFEVMRSDAERTAAREPEQIAFSRDVSTMDHDRTAARVFAGVGVALGVTGGALLLFGRTSPARPTVSVDVSPASFTSTVSVKF